MRVCLWIFTVGTALSSQRRETYVSECSLGKGADHLSVSFRVIENYQAKLPVHSIFEFRKIVFSTFTLSPSHNSMWVFILWGLVLETSPKNAFGDAMKIASPSGLYGVPGKKSLWNFLTKTLCDVTKLSPQLVEPITLKYTGKDLISQSPIPLWWHFWHFLNRVLHSASLLTSDESGYKHRLQDMKKPKHQISQISP